MFNVHKIAAAASALLIMIASYSCSDNKRAEEARSVLAEAQKLVADHDYPAAIAALDTLDKKYRDCLDVRREGTTVRLTALSDLSRDSLASAEQQLRAVSETVDRLAPEFKKIDVEGTDGYYVAADIYTGREMNATGIQARVDDQGYCFLVANVAGRRIGLNAISCDGATTPFTESVEIEGSEIMSVTQEAAAPVLEAIAACSDKSATVTLLGTKGKVPVKLDSRQIGALRATWEYARALQQQRRLNIALERLTRQLQRLDDQLANSITVPEDEK